MSPKYEKPQKSGLIKMKEEQLKEKERLLEERSRNLEQAVGQKVGEAVSKEINSLGQLYQNHIRTLQQEVSLLRQTATDEQKELQVSAKKDVTIELDREACISCGYCADVCPQIFEATRDLLQDGRAVVKKNWTGDCYKEAAKGCPTSAISYN